MVSLTFPGRFKPIIYICISFQIFYWASTSKVWSTKSDIDKVDHKKYVVDAFKGKVEGQTGDDHSSFVDGQVHVERNLPRENQSLLVDGRLHHGGDLPPVENRGVLKQRLPSVLIIGVEKCGTHALLDMLSMHPKIVKAPYELNYFSDKSFYKKGVDAYRKMMPYAYEDQIVIEKSPMYFRVPEVPSRIHKYNATIKLILLVKEPVHRLISGYGQEKAMLELGLKKSYENQRTLKPFEDLVIDKNGEVIETQIVKLSIYWPSLKNYLEVFPLEQILILDGDAVVENPLPVVEKVEKFLNIGKEITASNLYFNATKGFWCMDSQSISGCLPSSKGRKHEEVRPEVISKLRQFYAPHNEHFYAISGINFHWPVL